MSSVEPKSFESKTKTKCPTNFEPPSFESNPSSVNPQSFESYIPTWPNMRTIKGRYTKDKKNFCFLQHLNLVQLSNLFQSFN